MKARQFVDSAKVYAAAGRGGDGAVSFRREKFVPLGGPDGGDGGRGGHVILRADKDVDSLIALYYSPHRRARDGGPGRGKGMHGRNGEDHMVKVPCGTEIWDNETGERMGDLVCPGSEMIVARGGKGGLGNRRWVSPTNRAPTQHTDGEASETRTLRLELKLIADVGLVGFPNAGKSSLLSAISNAHPKVAPYPFTTLNPIIGAMPVDDYRFITIADIPGLIKGAHEGAGLGDAFLRHVERAPFLLLVLDMAGAEGRDPVTDCRILLKELKCYGRGLARRPMLVAANKMDLPKAEANLKAFVRKTRKKPIPISAVTGQGIPELMAILGKMASWARDEVSDRQS